ncbi:hypothetical protein LEN26_006053 [Aphanomyces euteiches]|nr:hypothetical protein LEN26_006053 [Aphanomyces euteiches]
MKHVSSPELTDDAVEQALELTHESTWDARGQDESVYVEKQFELYRSLVETSTLPKYYMKAWFPYSADTLLNVLNDLKYRKQWDSSVKQAYVVGHPDSELDDVDIVYWCVKMPWPFTNRDYVYYRRIVLVKDTFVILAQAGTHKDVPSYSQTQRVEAFHSHLVVRAAGVNSCELFMSYTDESNYSIPNALINWGFSAGLPSYLNDLRAACANYADYIRSLNDDGLQCIPSQLVRTRIERRNILKRAFSLRNARQTQPLRRSKSSSEASPIEHDLVVEFKQSNTGLALEPYLHHTVVGKCEKNSEAAKAKVTQGLQIVSIDGNSVVHLAFVEVVERIQRASRPLIVGFKYGKLNGGPTGPPLSLNDATSAPFVPPHVMVYYEDGIHDVLAPLEKDTGAVLTAERFDWPAGSQIVQVDELRVVGMAFTEIIHHLRRDNQPRKVHFQAAPASSSDGKKTIAHSLTKKLSRAFKSSSNSKKMIVDTPAVPAENASNNGDHVLADYSKIHITLETLEWSWTHIQYLIDEERLFSAADLLDKVRVFLQTFHATDVNAIRQVDAIREAMAAKAEVLRQVQSRRDQGMTALHEFNNDKDAGWRFAQTYFGVSTHWKPGNDGTVWIKLDGVCEDVDVFNSLAVIRETDLFNMWVPFCNKVELLDKLARVEILTYVNLALPFLQRDAVIHAFGINATYEHRCILLLGQSPNEENHPNVTFPPIKGWNADRMQLRAFRALIEPYARNRARTCIVANVDPKCPVPQSLLNFTIKKMAGILLYLLMREAQKIEKSATESTPTSNPYTQRILHDPFYQWLRLRMDKWFDLLEDGKLPPAHTVRSPQDVATNSNLYGQRINVSVPKHTPIHRQNSKPTSRPWIDYVYVIPFWPYLLLTLVFSICITRETSWLVACLWKAALSCAYAWFGVAGLMTWQARQQVPMAAELSRLRWRVLGYAIAFEIVSSTCVYLWFHHLVCFLNKTCHERQADSTAHFWLFATSFFVATGLVAIQYVVKLHI